MDDKTKDSIIIIIPLVILLVGVGTVTKYNLLYVIPAGIVGGLIGLIILKLIKNRR